MKKFITTIKNIFSIEELRNRILLTLGFLLIFRLGSFIILPGVDPGKLIDQGGIFNFLNVFLGGAFQRASIGGSSALRQVGNAGNLRIRRRRLRSRSARTMGRSHRDKAIAWLTQKPVMFELTEGTRKSIGEWLKEPRTTGQ